MRADKALMQKGIYEFGEFRLNASERLLERAGQPISLAPKALDVLIALVERRGRLVEKEDLMRKVWPDTFVEDNSLAFNISVLRKLFGESGVAPRYIETVPKRGYRFIADVTEAPENHAENPALAITPPRAPAPALRGGLVRWRYLGAAVLVLTLAAIGIVRIRYQRTPGLTDTDTIILTDFVNKTGDPVFDGTLSQGLAVQLEQSPFLRLASEGQIRRTLRLMGRPSDARLTPELARDVCRRTGTAAVVEGSIASLGSRYAIGLRAINCTTGDVLDNEQLQAARKQDVLDTLSRAARNFRSRVGESAAALGRHATPLEEATTPSLEALQVYSAALKVHFSSGARNALPLFRRAVEIDPEFAMAHSYLGRMYANLDESDLAAESTERAWRLRDRVSDREKFSIATRYQALVTGNMEETRETCEASVRTYYRDPQPHIGLAGYYNATGEYEKAIAEGKKAMEMDPDFSIGYDEVAAAEVYSGRLGEAEDTLRRGSERGLETDEFSMVRYDIAFLRGDAAEMARVAERAHKRPGAENWIDNREAFALGYSGRLEEARNVSRLAVNEAIQAGQRERAGLWEAGAAVREAFFGNKAEARRRATAALDLSHDREVEYGAAFALAFAGYSPASRTLADDLERRFPEDTSVRFSYLPALRARLALNAGEAGKALDLLETAAPGELGAPHSSMHGLFGALYPAYVRGQAYLALRRGAEAGAEFRKIQDHPGVVASDPAAAVARLQLGRALVLAGDKAKAKDAYSDFLTLWKDADPNIPMAREARAEYARLK